MRFPLLNVLRPCCTVVLGLALGASLPAAVTSGPVGYVNIPLLRDSDTVVAVPLAPAIEFAGQVGAIAAAANGQFDLTVAGTPGLVADQFKNLYYIRLETGARRGMYFTITGNTAGRLTLDAAGFDFSTIAAGDAFCIRKYWTLAALFPPAAAGTAANPLTASAGTLGPQRRSQVIIPNNGYAGTNLPAVGVYYFTADGWHQAVAGNPTADHIILHPDSYFTVRQPAAIADDVTWGVTGSVVLEDQRIPLFTRTAGAQDNALALNRPVDLRLADTGLETGFAASASTLGADRRDQLLVFDNSARSQNKSAAAVYYRVGDNWIKAVSGNPAANDDVLGAATGFVVRKAATSDAGTSEWLNSLKY
ncbi:MAG: TIGR02597 family protein [Verrucomicrobia bacterium]|nr:TIGR02597 family protein [Verrucomicrobiota bacterium]